MIVHYCTIYNNVFPFRLLFILFTSFCRFVQNQPGCHGFAVLKYLAHTGSVGSRVNLSGSSLRSARTFLIFILPRVIEPTLSIKTDVTVAKNSHQNTIRVSKKLLSI